MSGSRTAQIGNTIALICWAATAVIVIYSVWFIFLSTDGEFKDRLIVGTAFLTGAGVTYGAGMGFRVGLSPG